MNHEKRAIPSVWRSCSCGSKRRLDFCRLFPDGLIFLRCADCRKRKQFTSVPAEELTAEQMHVLAAHHENEEFAQ